MSSIKNLVAKLKNNPKNVNFTPELHRKLAIEAAEEKVSLNRYVNYKLAG